MTQPTQYSTRHLNQTQLTAYHADPRWQKAKELTKAGQFTKCNELTIQIQNDWRTNQTWSSKRQEWVDHEGRVIDDEEEDPEPFETECWYCGSLFTAQDIADTYCCQRCQDLAADYEDPDSESLDRECEEVGA